MSYAEDLIYHKVLLEKQKNRIFLETLKKIKEVQEDIKIIASSSDLKNINNNIKEINKIIDKSYINLRYDAEEQLKLIAKYEKDFQESILLNSVVYGNKKKINSFSNELLYKAIFSDPIQGLSFIDNLSVINQSIKKETESAIRIGVFNGESVNSIRSRVQTKINISNHKYNSFIRTAVQNVTHSATKLTYENNKEFIKRYQYISIIDGRTTSICEKLNKKVFNVGEGPTPPQHFNCRSFTIPIFSDEDIINLSYVEFAKNEKEKNNIIIETNSEGQFKQDNKIITIEQQRKIEEKRLKRKI